MIKLVVFWTRPADEQGFEEHYRSVHLPLAKTVPTDSVETMRFTKGETYRIAQLGFPTVAQMKAAMASSAGAALAADAKQLQDEFGVTSTSAIADVDE